MQIADYPERVVVAVGTASTLCLSLQAAQVAGRACRVSCATTAWSSVIGCLAVSASSLAAGQASFAIQRYLTQGPGKTKDFVMSKEDAALSVIIGVVGFKINGGHFRKLMPSHVCHPGALASFSVRANGQNLASRVQSQKIRKAFLKDGCHHCGSRSGRSIADHIPPRKIVKVLQEQKKKGFWINLFNLKGSFWKNSKTAERTSQRLYPQCESCMKRQSAFLLNGKDPFIFHWKRGLPKPSHLSGLLLGAFTYKGDSNDKPKKS